MATEVRFWANPGLFWVLSVLVFLSQRTGLYERESGYYIRYFKPIPQRVSCFLLAISFPWAATYLKPFSWHWPEYIISLALAVGLIYLSGPSEILINIDKKIYTVRSGWPLLPKIQRGTLEEISGIRITRNSEGCNYMLSLRWKYKQGGILIGQFGSKNKAEEAAARVQRSLQIKVPIEYASLSGQ